MIIITGAHGFIGSNLITELQQRSGQSLLAVDYLRREYFSNIDTISPDEFYTDLRNFNNVTAIFHEGAISSTTETNVELLKKRNIDCSIELMKHCANNNIPLSYASSAAIYGNINKEIWHQPYKSANPLNHYAKSKYQMDLFAYELIANSKIQGFRYFNVHGPNEDHKNDQASPYHKFNKQLRETGKIKLFEGSKEFYRDFVPVETVVGIKLKTMTYDISGIFDLGTEKPKSFYEVAAEVALQNGTIADDVIEWVPMPNNLKEHYQKYSCANMGWLEHLNTSETFTNNILRF